tara:strand:+ start:74 stop:1048 length:975 start_codon:yes stop_codon:yes gene_type:complete
MQSFYVRNVAEALYVAKQALLLKGVEVETRNGPALEFPTPVTTVYTHSRERVLFYPERDANPYFHFMEGMWMLAGRNDVDWISQFNSNISNYSDDGEVFHGAYGFRWREWFGGDQLKIAQHRLMTFKNDRRAVVGMWDPWEDLREHNAGKDYPCNTQAFFWAREGKLNMSIVNRSNDMIWGAYGANAVHMSMLLEYMAAMTGFQVGLYYQISNNLHAYKKTLAKLDNMQPDYNSYLLLDRRSDDNTPTPLVTHPDTFDEELRRWIVKDRYRLRNAVFADICEPMRKSWDCWKQKNLTGAVNHAFTIRDAAWRKACVEWLQRRMK